tara:strand:+ start:856 stop:1680 length:825 start_codon:yes stop_codon:yes gene_type:complete
LIRFRFIWALALLGLTCFSGLFADEPIMNEMPRWSGGWGVQTVLEQRTEKDLLLGKRKAHAGYNEEVDILHLEGVYTWKKSIRMTVKLPYVLNARRETPDGAGGKMLQKDNGMGDLTLALPLKKYFNLDGRSGAWTLKPMLRIPLAGEGEYKVYDNEWGHGLGLGYGTETAQWHFHFDVNGWVYHEDEPFESFSSLNLGYNFEAANSNGMILWETDFHYEDDGSKTLSAGPAFYWNVNDTTHLRLAWQHDFYDRQGILDHGNGNDLKLSIGWVF